MDEDWENCSLSEKLVHKVTPCMHAYCKSWKARTAAYEEIGKKCFSFTENDFVKYSETLKAMVGDTNQAAQEVGLTAVAQYLTHAPPQLS